MDIDDENAVDSYNGENSDVLSEFAREAEETRLINKINAERGEYTLSDYFKPRSDDFRLETTGAGLGAGTLAAYFLDALPEALLGVVPTALGSSYLVSKAEDYEMGAKALENSLDYWGEKLDGGFGN